MDKKIISCLGFMLFATGSSVKREGYLPIYEIVESARKLGLKISPENFSKEIGDDPSRWPILIDTRHQGEDKDYRHGKIPMISKNTFISIELDARIDPWSTKYFDDNVSETPLPIVKFSVEKSERIPDEFIVYLRNIILKYPNKKIYILCQAGIRSSSFALFLYRFYNIKSQSVEGGFTKIDSRTLSKITEITE
jgi:rhodanese-related sulfurtransferase